MGGQLRELLEHVLEGEPPIGDEVDAVFRDADRLRRRRFRTLLGAGLATVVLVAATGYLLTDVLLPRSATLPVATGAPPAAPVTSAAVPGEAPAPAPSATVDPAREVLEPLLEGRNLRVDADAVERGEGWRRYPIIAADGSPRGSVKVAVYDVPDELCFPVRADPAACARPDRADGFASVRYDDVSDENRQVRQTIARRLADGRTVNVLAAGERDAGAQRGKPPLTGAQAEEMATADRLYAAFGPRERCNDSDTCPDFRVEVPVGD